MIVDDYGHTSVRGFRVPGDRHPKARRGQAVVEFALVLPVLALLVMGAIDLGRVFYSYEALANAAREGARYCALKQTASTLSARVSGEVNGTVSGVAVAPSTCPAVPEGSPVTVTVSATFTPVTPIAQGLFSAGGGSGSITLQAAATMMMTE